jgi:NAD+ kinase
MVNNKTINIISNRNYESRKTKKNLIYQLRKNGFNTSEKYDADAVLNICIGGDGAFLRAVHRNAFPEIPFIGINTGHLGFFQELQPNEIDKFISMYKEKSYEIEKVCMVDAKVCTKDKCYYLTGINEIVIKGVKSKVIHIEMYIDDNHLQRFSGDGLIISTPSGSTAYNFSAGGSIVYPSISSLQITPLAPINSSVYRSLPTSIIVAGESSIRIKPELRYENSILVVNDGMEFKYDNIEEVQLTMSDKHVNKLTFNKDTYWNNLKSKFL